MFTIRVGQAVAETHDAAGIGTMMKAQRVANLVHSFFHDPRSNQALVAIAPQTGEGNERRFPGTVRNAEYELQASLIEIDPRHTQQMLTRCVPHAIQQHGGAVLLPPRTL